MFRYGSLCFMIFITTNGYSIGYSLYKSFDIISNDLYNEAKNKNTPDFLRVCYYSSGNPEPFQINGTLCTHIIKGFSSIVNGTFNPGSSEEVKRYIETADLKKSYPHLKIMVSIGGGGNDSGFSKAVSTQTARKKLIHSVLSFLITYNYDGLDIDWEFPVWNDFFTEDKKNFIHFLHEFREISYFQYNHIFVLSVAVAAPHYIIDTSYDVPGMAKYVDFINLMAYDYHDYRLYTPFTGNNSPLFKRFVEKAYFATLNTAWSSMYWYKKGMPLKKIMVGLPTYGHTYKLSLSNFHFVDAPVVGYGIGNGTVAFPDVCNFLKNGFTRKFDNESKVPYAYKGYDWFSYDDVESISTKALWVKSSGFGGVMTFDLNCDDYNGICDGKTKFPLHQVIYDILTKP